MEPVLDKLRAAQAKVAAAGDSCPDLETLEGGVRAAELIPADALEGGDPVGPFPTAALPYTIPLFQASWRLGQRCVERALGSACTGHPPTRSAAPSLSCRACLSLYKRPRWSWEAQAQAALCEAQALLDRCTSPAASQQHLESVVHAGCLVANRISWCPLDHIRRQAMIALFEEALARAEAQKCECRNRLACVL